MEAYFTYLQLVIFVSLYIVAFVFWFQQRFEIATFLALTILQGLFLLFLIYVVSTLVDNMNSPLYIIPILCWAGIGVGAIFSFVALLLFLITFRHLHIEYNIKHKADFKMPQQYSKMLREFKIWFITMFSFSIPLFVFCIMGVGRINMVPLFGIFVSQPNLVNFGPLLLPIMLCMIALGIIGGASYEIVLANMFTELNKRRVIVR
jgi:hypothetical protein